MNSPAKRRKTNSHVATTKPVRGLDFFFGKQTNKDSKVDNNSGKNKPLEESPDIIAATEELTDEQLARKLQDEWNEIDNNAASPNKPSPKQTTDEVLEQDLEAGQSDISLGRKSVSMEREDLYAEEIPVVDSRDAVKPKNTLSLQTGADAEDEICVTLPFDQSPLTFDPDEFLPTLRKHWNSQGGNASYALLTRCFVLINSTQSRIKIVDTLVNLLRIIIEGDPTSLLPAVWLATNSISPAYIDLELGLGGSAIGKALKKVCGLDNASLRKLSDKHGDAGDVAFEAKKRQSLTLRKPKPLSIKSVYDSLVRIANSKGTGSVENKQRIVERLVQDTRGAEETRYVVRTLVQHLRIGAVRTTMLIALSRAFLISRPPGADFPIKSRHTLAQLKKDELAEVWKSSEEIVKACHARRPNYSDLVPAMLEIGSCDELLIRCGMSMHIPLKPMLGNITRDLSEMLTKLQGRDFACEYKYDGQRAQVHCDDRGRVSIFSRHLELMTEKYPDLVALVPQIRGEGVRSFILEGEVVAVDRENGDLKTFQTLTNRARKDVAIGSVKIDVCLFAFDLMYLNGEELLNRPFRERRELLKSLFTEIPHHFTWVKSLDATSADSESVLEFFKSATDIKCEGIMVKVLDNLPNADLEEDLLGDGGTKTPSLPPTPSKPKKAARPKPKPGDEPLPDKDKGGRRKALLATYEPDKRIDSWLKVKKDYNTAADTLDLIPVAAWHGQGRKAKWWSPILLAVRNPETGCLEAVTKCMSGFTDKFYQAHKERYAEDGDNVISKPSYVDYEGGHPAVWFEPQEVWEIAFADISLSPTYSAAIGLVSEERGLSMRFPRFLRVREDKTIEEASTADFLAGLYRKQEARIVAEGGRAKPVVEEDEDE